MDQNSNQPKFFDASLEITDFLGQNYLMTYQFGEVATPYGTRHQTTVFLYPTDGKKGIFTGATIQSPQDEFNYDAGLITALFRAGEDVLVRSSGPQLDRFFSRYDYDNYRIEKAIKRWCRHILRKMYFDKLGPYNLVYNTMTWDELKAEVKKGNF